MKMCVGGFIRCVLVLWKIISPASLSWSTLYIYTSGNYQISIPERAIRLVEDAVVSAARSREAGVRVALVYCILGEAARLKSREPCGCLAVVM